MWLGTVQLYFDHQVINAWNWETLQPLQMDAFSMEYRWPLDFETHLLTMEIDPMKVLPELNENNNIANRDVWAPADLAMQASFFNSVHTYKMMINQ